MNSKKVNFLNALYSLLTLIIALILIASATIISNVNIYLNNGLINFIEDNISKIAIWSVISIIGFSIISAIQNRKNKKILFWKIALIISLGYSVTQGSLFNISMELEEWIRRILFGIIPIIIAIVNLCLIKKNKPKKIAIISYILAIIWCLIFTFSTPIFELFDYTLRIDYPYWIVVVTDNICLVYAFTSIVMMFIHIRSQENVTESKGRRKANIVIYGLLQTIVVFGLLITVVYSVIVCKINNSKLDSEVQTVKEEIAKHNANKKNLLIEVKKDSKYGLINEKGEEVVKPEYDDMDVDTFRYEDQEVEYVIAKKGDDFYFILKDNTVIDINKQYSSYIKNYYNNYIKFANKYRGVDFKDFYGFDISNYFSRDGESKLSSTLEKTENIRNVLKYDASDDYYDEKTDITYYTYKLNNGIELLVSDEEDDDGASTVITKKGNQIIQKDDNVLLSFDGMDIELYSNGSIPFVNFKKKIQGWYDVNTGKTKYIPGKYKILDITEDYYIIKNYNTENKEEILVDNTEAANEILEGLIIDKCKDGFIVTNINHKSFYIDENITLTSDEINYYNFIIEVERNNNSSLYIGINKDKNNELKCVMFDAKGKILTKDTYSRIGNNINWYLYTENKYKEYDSIDEMDRGFFGEEYDEVYGDNDYYDDEDEVDDEDEYKLSDLNNSNIKLNKVHETFDLINMDYTAPSDFAESDIEGYTSHIYETTKAENSSKKDYFEVCCIDPEEDYIDGVDIKLYDYVKTRCFFNYTLDNFKAEEITDKNGVKWFKVKIDVMDTENKVVYFYVTLVEDYVFNFGYEDYENNNTDTVNQIFDSIKLK